EIESIVDRLHRVPWQDREAFSVTLALTDTLHVKKFGGDTSFAAIADEAMKPEELGSALQRAIYTERKSHADYTDLSRRVVLLLRTLLSHRLGFCEFLASGQTRSFWLATVAKAKAFTDALQ